VPLLLGESQLKAQRINMSLELILYGIILFTIICIPFLAWWAFQHEKKTKKFYNENPDLAKKLIKKKRAREEFKNKVSNYIMGILIYPVIILAGIFYFLLICLGIFLIWATFSTGGLYELKQINPGYPHPNKNVAFLIEKLNNFSTFDSFHVEQCWPYMPDWLKAKECVEVMLFCQSISPKDKEHNWSDFSDEFGTCFKDKRPTVGFSEIMRVGRNAFRAYVVYKILRFTKEESLSNSESKKWWKKPLGDWYEQRE
jgi:hypothetical protein